MSDSEKSPSSDYKLGPHKSVNRWIIISVLIGFAALAVPGIINNAPEMIESLQNGQLNPQVEEVTQVSPEQQVTAVSILVPVILVVVMQFASVARDVSVETVLETRWNRLTILHWVNGFILLQGLDLALKWGEFASTFIAMVVTFTWAFLPLLEVGWYDQVFKREGGIENLIDSSLMIWVVSAFVIRSYIDQIMQITPADPTSSFALYFSMGETLFRLILLTATVYVFVWMLERDAYRVNE